MKASALSGWKAGRLEGWKPKSDFYAVQERVIAGELTFDEAVKVVLTQPLP